MPLDPRHRSLKPYVQITRAFADLDTVVFGSVRFGDGSIAQIKGNGTVLLECKNGEHRSLPNVYYLSRLTANIISVGQLNEGGYQVLVEDGVMRVRDEDRRLLAKIPCNPGRLYVLDVTIARPVCLAAHTNDDSWTWHARFGHINFTALWKMALEELVHGMPPITQVEQVCKACLAGKQRCAPFPQKALRRLIEALQLLHGDLCGPITPATPSGNRYSFFSWMIIHDICGCAFFPPKMKPRWRSSVSKLPLSARLGRSCWH